MSITGLNDQGLYYTNIQKISAMELQNQSQEYLGSQNVTNNFSGKNQHSSTRTADDRRTTLRETGRTE